ncbi:MAG TPA: Do family serine endopeptidase [Parvularculaceae bacterium]|nr:Do family serine endopeptidase [Parvularculaceae bacterium]
MSQYVSRAAAVAAAIASLVLATGGATGAEPPRLLAPPISSTALSFADLVERVSPAVVSVMVEKEIDLRDSPQAPRDFHHFRRDDPEDDSGADSFDGGPQQQRMEAEGSGFFIDPAGHIVTNNHVVDGADKIEVRTSDGKTRTARLIGADALTDLAVLKVEAAPDQTFVQFGDDAPPRVGDWVVAVGSPFGLSGTVTSGIVSAIGGDGRNGQFLDFIQIDAPINRGNSGGPTFDLDGRVVGVNTAIFSTTGGSVGIGFAIPAKIARETAAQLIAHGSVTRGWLGVSIQDLTPDLAAALGRKDTKGSLVSDVLDGTPAAKAGLKSEDLVLKINGKTIDDSRDLTRTVAALPPGAKANVIISRGGDEQTVIVTLGEREDQPTAKEPPPRAKEDSLAANVGLRVEPLTAALRNQFQVPDETTGVVVTGVRPGSSAEDAGLRPGVVILEADGQPALSAAAIKGALDAAKAAGKAAILLRVQFGEAKQFAALALAKK